MQSNNSTLSRALHWFRALVRRGKVENEMDTELRFDLERRVEAKMAAGMSRSEAERSARREFGSAELAKEECRDERGTRWLEELWQDVRFGLRMLRKNSGFTAVAVLTLALGIGANTAIFSVVNGVLLNPLPFPKPDQLVKVDESKPNFPQGAIPYLNFLDWHRDNHSFSQFAVYRWSGATLTGVGDAQGMDGVYLTSEFFSMLGVNPVLGRTFSAAEDEIGASNVVIIGSRLWKQKFGSAQDIVGKGIVLDGKEYTVVGVIPTRKDLSLRVLSDPDFFEPLGQFPGPALRNRSAALGIHGIGRLKSGVSLEQARADLEIVTRHLAEIYPDANKGTGASLTPMKEAVVGSVRPFLLLLLGAVGLVLLISCVNVANLLLARATGRSREMAVRSALGAGTGRLVRQMLTESVLLALAGGGLGFILARFGTEAALNALPATLPRASEVAIDVRVLLFTIVVSIFAGVFFGLVPAVRMARRNVHETLKEGGRGGSGTRHRAQGALVVVEMALALVLLVGGGLVMRSLGKLWNVNSGFNPDDLFIFALNMPPAMAKATPAAIRTALRDFDQKLAAIPGVEAQAFSWGGFPLSSEDDTTFWVDGQPKPENQSDMDWALKYQVGPGYLKAMRIPLLSGRFFSERDDEHAQPVAVVDEVLARKFFPNGEAIGKGINMGNRDKSVDTFRIIGIVGHVKQWGLDTDDQNSLRAQVYFPFLQLDDGMMPLIPSNVDMVVRSAREVPVLMDSIRQMSKQISPDQVIPGVRTMKEIMAQSLASKRFSMILLAAFAALALVLASIGLYGVIAYLVGQRTHEIGIRMALGAQRGDVLRWVMGEGGKLALAGVVIGLVAAAGLTRLLAQSSLLFGVSATDPLTFGGVAGLLIVVALAACWIPARRAMRVDPMTALRHE